MVVNAITSQVNVNYRCPHGTHPRYRSMSPILDSMPGLFFSSFIVVGLAFAFIFLSSTTLYKGDGTSYYDKLFPCFIATVAAGLVLYFCGCAFGPLAFTADVNAGTVVGGTLATLIFTIPVAFLEYTPKENENNSRDPEKNQSIIDRLQIFEPQINNVKKIFLWM